MLHFINGCTQSSIFAHMQELIINNTNVRTEYGVRMGEDFLKELDKPANFKDYVSNTSRTEDGVRYVVTDTYMDERSLTLPFVLIGESSADARTKLMSFLAIMRGEVTLKVPILSDDVYHLIVTGCSSYSVNTARTIYSIKFKLTEPNPANRV